jgi:RNA polymerase sigma factor (sigma-70 family)
MKREMLDDESDGQLIRRFVERRDEQAFAALVERRGALVAGVCARMTHCREDAQDAFQAVFLVLAKRAAALARDASLAGWLHAVAVRVCLRQRRDNLRTQRRVQEAREVAHEFSRPDQVAELRLVIDEELAALPRRLRDVLLLCDLEGHSREEVARALSVPVGTVSSRLARGREAMRKRLAGHVPSLAVGGVAITLAKCGQAAPAVSADLVQTTVRNAHVLMFGTAAAKAALGTRITSLAEGVVYAMIVSRWKVAVCLVVLLACTLFGGTLAPGIVPGLMGTASAATVFFDDFEDGSATDGSPVAWQAATGRYPATTFSVLQGDLHLTVSQSNTSGSMFVPLPQALADASIQAVVRLEGGGNDYAGVFARADNNGVSHTLEIEADGDVFLGIAVSGVGMGTFTQVATDLRPTQEDVILRLDAIGNTMRAWVWRAGEAMPQEPLLTATDTANQVPTGVPGVFYGASIPPEPTLGTAIFRSVLVADMPIPEPSSLALGSLGAVALAILAFRSRPGLRRSITSSSKFAWEH